MLTGHPLVIGMVWDDLGKSILIVIQITTRAVLNLLGLIPNLYSADKSGMRWIFAECLSKSIFSKWKDHFQVRRVVAAIQELHDIQ